MSASSSRPSAPMPPRALLAQIVDSSHDAVLSKTLDGIITSWNPAAERMFGYAASEAIGQPIALLVPTERLQEELDILQHLRRGERVTELETVRVCKDGRRLDVSVTSSPVRDDDGRIVGASKVVHDITAARATARALAQSEARFRAIFDNSAHFMGLMTLEGVVMELNRAVGQLGSAAAAGLAGRYLWEAPWFDSSAAIRERLQLACAEAAGGEFTRFELALARSAEAAVTLDFSMRPIRDASGQVALILAEARDISERKRHELALRESAARLSGIVESAMDAIISVDDRGEILIFNEAAATMFGHRGADLRGQGLEQFMPERFRAGHMGWMSAFGRSGTTLRSMGRPGEIVALRADGTEFPIEASISRVEVGGRPLYTVIIRDLSERKQAHADRRALEAQLREAQKMEAVGTLAGGIAHDFNNIIASILGNVGLARQELLAEHPARVDLEQIERAAQRARGVVRQILAFSRRQPQELLNQPIRAVIDEALALLKSTLPAVVRLDTRLADEAINVRLDANQIHQVLVNLCTNAWHALQGSTGRIEVGLEAVELDADAAMRIGNLGAGRHAHLWVTDNGCGMDEATRARIFEPFFTTKRRGEGTGLGLAVVHGIVVGHRGAIAVNSGPGLGSTFHLYFPACAVEPVAASHSGAAGAAAIGSGRRVVYIDDDEVMRLMVQRVLDRDGFDARCYGDARLALAAIAAPGRGCDIVVSDYNMADVSGLEVAAELAKVAPELPVVISSGYITSELRAGARRAGVRALLAKENTFEELPELILSVLRGESRLDSRH